MSTMTTLVLVLNLGTVKIELMPDVAPKHVAQIQKLVAEKPTMALSFIESLMALWPKPVMSSMVTLTV